MWATPPWEERRMICNHFLVADPGGRITGWEGADAAHA